MYKDSFTNLMQEEKFNKRAGLYLFFLTFICGLFCSHVKANNSIIRPLIIFDSNDQVITTLEVSINKKGFKDVNDKYDFILIEPTLNGIKIRQSAKKNSSREKILIIATFQNNSWEPVFAWGEYRIFSRLALTNISPPWSDLLISSSNRSRLLSLKDVANSTHPTTQDLWGYKIPADSIGLNKTEFFVSKRPLWQSTYSRTYSLTVSSVQNSVEFVSSNPSTTFYSFPEEIARIIPSGKQVIGYVTQIPVNGNKAKFYYIPSDPLPIGDALTVYIRNLQREGICPLECSSQNEVFCPVECQLTINPICTIEPIRPFIAVSVTSQITNKPQEPVLKIYLGGIDHFTNTYKSVQYSIEFLNGFKMTGTLTDAKQVDFISFPSNVPVKSGYLKVEGVLIDVSDKEEQIKPVIYKIVEFDKAYVGASGLYAERFVNCQPVPNALPTRGVAFTVPRSKLSK